MAAQDLVERSKVICKQFFALDDQCNVTAKQLTGGFCNVVIKCMFYNQENIQQQVTWTQMYTFTNYV